MEKNKPSEKTVCTIEWQIVTLSEIKCHSTYSKIKSYFTDDPFFLSDPNST